MLPSILQSIKWDEKYTKSSIPFNCNLRQCRQIMEFVAIVYTHTHTHTNSCFVRCTHPSVTRMAYGFADPVPWRSTRLFDHITHINPSVLEELPHYKPICLHDNLQIWQGRSTKNTDTANCAFKNSKSYSLVVHISLLTDSTLHYYYYYYYYY